MDNKYVETIPGNEVNLALLTILIGCKVVIIDSITTLIGGDGSSEIIIGFIGATDLVDGHLLHLLLNLEHYESIFSFGLQIQKLELALIMNRHSWWWICLSKIANKTSFKTNLKNEKQNKSTEVWNIP